MVAMAVAAFAMVSCSDEPTMSSPMNADSGAMFSTRASANDYTAAAAKPRVTVTGDITSDATWTSGNVYVLNGIVRVASGATLTIEPGTFIIGTTNTPSVLVIGKGGRINAVGTPATPIVFTSFKMLDGGTAEAGDFGGVVLLGNAVINQGSAFIEGIEEGDPNFEYGGSNNADNSGTMQYVRIEYAGYVLRENVELNGLTCGGVGRGTTLDHIQVSWGRDDSFEFFGGCVNASYLISYAHDDDGFDMDFGYTGTITYGLDLANPASTHSLSSGSPDSNGIELDNDANSSDLTPITHPTLNYVTIVGTNPVDAGSYKFGARIRRNGEITMTNSIVIGYPNAFELATNGPGCSFTNVGVNPGFTGFTTVAVAGGMANPYFSLPVIATKFAGVPNRGAFATAAPGVALWKFNEWTYFM